MRSRRSVRFASGRSSNSSGLHDGHKRFLNPHAYPVGLAPALYDLKTRLVLAARNDGAPEAAALELGKSAK